jgi:hypothetical protein
MNVVFYDHVVISHLLFFRLLKVAYTFICVSSLSLPSYCLVLHLTAKPIGLLALMPLHVVNIRLSSRPPLERRFRDCTQLIVLLPYASRAALSTVCCSPATMRELPSSEDAIIIGVKPSLSFMRIDCGAASLSTRNTLTLGPGTRRDAFLDSLLSPYSQEYPPCVGLSSPVSQIHA